MKPLDRRPSSAVPRHLLLLLILGLASGPARADAAPAAAGAASAATPMANARLTVGEPATTTPPAAPATPPAAAADLDPVTARVRDHASRPLGGAPGIAVGSGQSRSALPEPPASAFSSEDAVVLPADGSGRFGGAGELLRVGAALGVVLAIAVVLARGLRRFGGAGRAGRPAGVLEILARYPVGRGQQLVVLRLDRRLLLVHQGGGRMEPLTEVTQPDEVAALIGRLEAGSSGSEADRFRRTLAEFEHGRGPAGLRPDGRFGDERDEPRAAGRRNAAPAFAPAEPGEPGHRASGLAAAIRAGRRQAAYGAARLAGEPRREPASAHDGGRPQVEIVDLTRTGGRGPRR